jgi:hypothetical protein
MHTQFFWGNILDSGQTDEVVENFREILSSSNTMCCVSYMSYQRIEPCGSWLLFFTSAVILCS